MTNVRSREKLKKNISPILQDLWPLNLAGWGLRGGSSEYTRSSRHCFLVIFEFHLLPARFLSKFSEVLSFLFFCLPHVLIAHNPPVGVLLKVVCFTCLTLSLTWLGWRSWLTYFSFLSFSRGSHSYKRRSIFRCFAVFHLGNIMHGFIGCISSVSGYFEYLIYFWYVFPK